jgi:hypothetical protein
VPPLQTFAAMNSLPMHVAASHGRELFTCVQTEFWHASSVHVLLSLQAAAVVQQVPPGAQQMPGAPQWPDWHCVAPLHTEPSLRSGIHAPPRQMRPATHSVSTVQVVRQAVPAVLHL